VFQLTLGLLPGLQTFHPSGIRKKDGAGSLFRERGKEILMFQLTLGLHPGLQTFHPFGIRKRDEAGLVFTQEPFIPPGLRKKFVGR